MILSSGAKYNQINFSKNHVSGNARKIGITVIWWFTLDGRAEVHAWKDGRDRVMSGCSGDLNSQFGLMDAILDEKLGFKPKRIEGELLLCKKRGTSK